MAAREPAADAPLTDTEIAWLLRPLQARRLALAVSGGVDSMVLMHLVARWLEGSAVETWKQDAGGTDFSGKTGSGPDRPIGCPRVPPSLSATAEWVGADGSADAVLKAFERNWVVVLTVDHGLRPESAAEAEFVAAEARRLGLPHQTLHWRRARAAGRDAVEPLSGLQEKARAARYELMADAVEAECWTEFAHGFSSPFRAGRHKRAIVTAHHRDDMIETFLMRLKRGAGIDGLSSIRTNSTMLRPPIQARPYPTVVDICRPLLDVPKTRLLATARAMGIDWREDPSNRAGHFERVRLRKEMDTLAAIGFEPGALRTSIRRLQRAREIVEQHQRRQMLHWRDKGLAFNEHGGLYCEFAPNPDIDGDEFSALVDARCDIMLRMLRYAIQAFGGGGLEPELSQLEDLQRHLDACWRDAGWNSGVGPPPAQARRDFAARSARTLAGCRIDYCPGEGGRIRVWREAGRAPLPELMLEPGDGGWWDNRFAISVGPEAPARVTVRALGTAGWTMLKARVPSLARWRDVPPGAFATLPSIWRGDELLSVPYFEHLPRDVPGRLRREIAHEWDAFSGPASRLYRAEFKPVADI